MSSSAQTVRTALDNGVLTVRLHRLESANARNQVMRDELSRLWAAAADDRAVRAVVLTGAGGRYFSAGMDLKEANQDEDPTARRDRLQRSRDIELLAALPQPTIAAINGYALGGGLEMTLACDMRLIADHAQVGFPEVALGIVPAGGGTQRLPRLIGYARACELVLSGRRLGAADAVRWGIASRAVPPAELFPTAFQLAEGIAALPDVAVRSAKNLLRMSQHAPISDGIDAELDALLALMSLARSDATAAGRIALTSAIRASGLSERGTPDWNGVARDEVG